MPYPEGSGCGNTLCRLHRGQAELYGHYPRDSEPFAEVDDVGRKMQKGMIYLLTHFVIQSEAKNLGNTMAGLNVDVHEILPPFGRLNDK